MNINDILDNMPNSMKGFRSEVFFTKKNSSDKISYVKDGNGNVNLNRNDNSGEATKAQDSGERKSFTSSIYGTLKEMGFSQAVSFFKPAPSTVVILILVLLSASFFPQDGWNLVSDKYRNSNQISRYQEMRPQNPALPPATEKKESTPETSTKTTQEEQSTPTTSATTENQKENSGITDTTSNYEKPAQQQNNYNNNYAPQNQAPRYTNQQQPPITKNNPPQTGNNTAPTTTHQNSYGTGESNNLYGNNGTGGTNSSTANR